MLTIKTFSKGKLSFEVTNPHDDSVPKEAGYVYVLGSPAGKPVFELTKPCDGSLPKKAYVYDLGSPAGKPVFEVMKAL